MSNEKQREGASRERKTRRELPGWLRAIVKGLGAHWPWLLASIFLGFGGFAAFHFPPWLATEWLGTQLEGLSAPDASDRFIRTLGTSSQMVLLSLGGIIGVVGVTLSYLRHRAEHRAARLDRSRFEQEQQRLEQDRDRESRRREEYERDREAEAVRALHGRYLSAVELLSDKESPTKRVAGINALVAVADDWLAVGYAHEAQTCISTICSYLTTPFISGNRALHDGMAPDELSVRLLGFTRLAEHLRFDHRASWSNMRVNLSGLTIDFPLALHGIQLHENGYLVLENLRLLKRGSLTITGAILRGNSFLNMFGVKVDSGAVLTLRYIRAESSSTFQLTSAAVEGKLALRVRCNEEAYVGITEFVIHEGAQLSLQYSKFDGADGVSLSGEVMNGGSLNLKDVRLIDGTVLDLGLLSLQKCASIICPNGYVLMGDFKSVPREAVGSHVTLPSGFTAA